MPCLPAEYDDPADRRFHAQPIACPDCGPRLWLEVAGAVVTGDPIGEAGAPVWPPEQIIGVKGLGGFHLACDATDAAAVALLRQRKRRPAKPFALMARADMLARFCAPTDGELQLMRDPAAPIVLVRGTGALPESVAPGMARLGVMLPPPRSITCCSTHSAARW